MRIVLAVLLLTTFACAQNPLRRAPSAGAAVEGQDYLVLTRARFWDGQGYLTPVEAFSALVPRGWTVDGGIVWKSPFACQGEMVSSRLSAASPGGAIRYQSLPVHSWASNSDPQLRQFMISARQQGGCEVSGPVPAEVYFRQVMLPRELPDAAIVNIRRNPQVMQELGAQNEKYRAMAQSQGAMGEVRTDAIVVDLRFPNGDEGIALCSVVDLITTVQNAYTGALQHSSISVASERSWIRFPAARRAEAERFLVTLRASYRTNPEWRENVNQLTLSIRRQRQANSDQVLAQLEQAKLQNQRLHEQRMADIRRQGEANSAAFQQRMSGMDQNYRAWEARQEASDRIQTSFVQAIREVETWRGPSGAVELSSGYDQAWTRGDGVYLLSNKPGFDPASVFQDQKWQPLQRAR